MVKNLPANAGDMGLIPGLKDSICCRESKPTTAEPMFWSRQAAAIETIFCNKRSHCNEKLVYRN